MRKFAWSYSALNNYETCPKQFYHLRVKKDVQQAPSEHLSYGNEVHKALELRIKNGKKLPLGLRHLEGIADRLENTSGDKHTELRLGINRNFEPVDFFASDVYCRSVIDLAIVNSKKAVVVDYKTGKMKEGFDQLLLATGVLMCHMPELVYASVAYVWTKEKCLTASSLDREDLHKVWNTFLPRVNKFEHAWDEVSFPPRPNYLCKNYCPVKKCPHHGV